LGRGGSELLSIQLSEYLDVRKRASELGCSPPNGVVLLPRNFDRAKSKQELVHESSMPTVRTILRQARIPETRLEEEGDHFPYAQQNAFEWIGPIIFVSASFLTQNPDVISVALGMISDYLTDFFKGIPGARKTAKFDIVIGPTKSESYKRIHYDGDVDGIREMEKVVRALQDE
jgi:hypothetical protein